MGAIAQNLQSLLQEIDKSSCKLIAVTKTHDIPTIMEVYEQGCKVYGENKVQELCFKYENMPKDIEWHLIGHLQKNKVKYLVPFVSLIHSVDSLDLLKEINKQAAKINRVQPCLLQVYIAKGETKFGLTMEETEELFKGEDLKLLPFVKVVGLMGMASNTDNTLQVHSEFKGLKDFFDHMKAKYFLEEEAFKELSMGMSGDYLLAITCGSTMIRVGSAIFGARNYQ